MSDEEIMSYNHPTAKRKNNPPAGLAPEGKVREAAKVVFDYNPHLPPVLRFDPSGKSDALPELLQKALTSRLSEEEVNTLADALRNRQPWLEWAGKREAQICEVDPVALHIHERVSTQAILRVAARQDVPRTLFADPEQEYREAVQFYQHDIDWTNRLILGDSLQVMASLAKREDLAGKVQCIYMDPPYGIKYASNFQSEVGKRDVKDKPEDLTREPEMVKAYRDTWTLGVHSYLAYLRDRLFASKELLADSGCVFVQISDENVHRVRALMDEVFEAQNFCSLISFKKTGGMGNTGLDGVCDYLLWYARSKETFLKEKYRPLYTPKQAGEGSGERYSVVEEATGLMRPLRNVELEDETLLPPGARLMLGGPLTSQTASASTLFEFEINGRKLRPNKGGWKTNAVGMRRLQRAERLFPTKEFMNYA